jgi:hypothetical protein
MYTTMVQSCKTSRSTIEQKLAPRQYCLLRGCGKVLEIGTSFRFDNLSPFSLEKRATMVALRESSNRGPVELNGGNT